MQHHLYKEPQDHVEEYDQKFTRNSCENLLDNCAEKVSVDWDKWNNMCEDKPRSEMRLTLIIALSFTAGLVTALLSGLFARIV